MPCNFINESYKDMIRYSIVVPSHNPNILLHNLLASPGIFNHDVHVQYDKINICKTFNEIIKSCTEDIIIFIHHDVFLPESFFGDLLVGIQKLCYSDWGVIGVAGMTDTGNLSSTVSYKGSPLISADIKPTKVETIDELILVVKKRTFDKLSFDENITNNHLFGTDLCLQAKKYGMPNFVVDAFCIHNSSLNYIIPENYWITYEYIKEKWKCYLPIYTTCSVIK